MEKIRTSRSQFGCLYAFNQHCIKKTSLFVKPYLQKDLNIFDLFIRNMLFLYGRQPKIANIYSIKDE